MPVFQKRLAWVENCVKDYSNAKNGAKGLYIDNVDMKSITTNQKQQQQKYWFKLVWNVM